MSRSDQPLSRVLEENATFVHSLARSLVGDIHDANDLAQDTWLTALARPPRHSANVRSWLGTLVERLAGRTRRATSRRLIRGIAVARPESQASGFEEVTWREVLRRVATAVLTLEEPYQETVLLRYYEGLNATEIPTRMGVQAGTVRMRLKRALDSLRRSLDTQSGGDRQEWMRALVPFVGVGKIGSVATGSGFAACSGALVMGTTAKVTVGLIAMASIGAAGWQVIKLHGAPEQLAAALDSAGVELHADPSSLRSDLNGFADSIEARREVPGGTVEQSFLTIDKGIEDEAVPKHVELGFLPFPNRGAADFAAKYDTVDPATLHAMLQPLNSMMDKEVRRVADLRFEAGMFEEHDESTTRLPVERMSVPEMEAAFYFDKPQGLGRVWPVSRVVDGQTGHPRPQIAYLTEVENPELFAMQDEYLYVFGLWRDRDKAITESLTNGK